MSGSIAKAYVQIVPSAEGIKGKLSGIFGSEMPSAGKNAGKSFSSSLIGNIKTMIAAAGLGKMLTDAISAGANMEQSLGGIETLFKDSAATVIQNAEQAYRTAGMSANAYMEAVTGFSASLLQGLGGDTEQAAAIADMALTDMSDNANKMGTSMESIQNAYQGFAKQNYTMLDNLKLGYGGTKTEMERLLADAQKLTGVKYDIDNLADVYSAINAIQKEMKISGLTAEEAAEMVKAGLMTEEEAFEALGTTAKEASTTIAGSMASMKAAFSDVLANLTLGRDLGPSLNALAETVKTFLVGNLAPAVINIVSALPGAVATFLNGIIPGNMLSIVTTAISQLSAFISANLPTILSDGARIIGELASGFIQGVPVFLSAVGELIDSTITAIIAAGPSLLDSAFGMVDDLISGFNQNMPSFLEAVGEMLTKTVTAILDAAPSIVERGFEMVTNLVQGFLNNTPSFLSTVGNLLNQTLSALLAALPSMMQSGVNFVANLANGVINNLPAILGAAANLIGQLLATLASNLPQLLQKGIEMIANLAAGLIRAIPKAVAAIPQIISNVTSAFSGFDWTSIGANIISGIAAGIRNGVTTIINAAKQAAQSALRAAKNALGIKSPSRVMRDEVGKFIPAGIAVGIEDNQKTLSAAMKDLSASTVDSFDADLSMRRTAPVGTVPGTNYGDFSFTFHVHTAPGQDSEQIARALMQEMQFEYERRLAQI